MLEMIEAARVAGEVPDLANLVGGEWRRSSTGQSIAVTDPASGAVVGRVPDMSADEVRAAWDAAARGAAEWSRTSAISRGAVLARAAASIRELRDPVARLVTREMGKTLNEARGETERTADFFDYYAGLGWKSSGSPFKEHGKHGLRFYTRVKTVALAA